MSSRPVDVLLDDILDAVSRIHTYTEGFSKEQFLADGKTQDAVIRNLEIIGEAASRLPESFRNSHTDADWRAIIGLRHRVVHGYFGVDLEIIWQVLESDLNSLAASVQAIRNSLG